MKKLHLLVTSAGTSTAVGLIKSLASNCGISVFTADVNQLDRLPLGAFRTFGHAVVPFASDAERYVDAIRDAIEKFEIDFVFAIHDEEIRVLSEARSSGNLRVDGPRMPSEMVIACTDKLRMSQICLDHGIRSPVARDWDQFVRAPFYPVFVKPRLGVGSQGARLVQNEEQLPSREQAANLVFQDVCDGPEVTVDVLSGKYGVIAVARERLEVKAGVCTKGRIWYCPVLSSMAESLAAAFRLEGLFCFQSMMQAGEWSVTDINPRSGGATAMTVAAGVNLYEEYFADIKDGPDAQRFAALRAKVEKLPATIVTRYYQEHASVIAS
jgi:carbamoyl-phosphate synthase large subunit